MIIWLHYVFCRFLLLFVAGVGGSSGGLGGGAHFAYLGGGDTDVSRLLSLKADQPAKPSEVSNPGKFGHGSAGFETVMVQGTSWLRKEKHYATACHLTSGVSNWFDDARESPCTALTMLGQPEPLTHVVSINAYQLPGISVALQFTGSSHSYIVMVSINAYQVCVWQNCSQAGTGPHWSLKINSLAVASSWLPA